MKVLLADDSDFILERLEEMLSTFEEVEIVGSLRNGTEALEALRLQKPDLAIVDIKMPGLSGLQVLIEIRKEDTRVKMMILTFYASEHYRHSTLDAGADYFFSKVDDFQKIALVVAEMIENERTTITDNEIIIQDNEIVIQDIISQNT